MLTREEMTMQLRTPVLGLRAAFLGLFLALALASGGEALAQNKRWEGRKIDRSLAGRDAIQRQQVKRAYVAGAVAQNRRERVRDYREDRYRRERYYDRHHDHHHDRYDDDNGLSRVLVGVAIGAVATGVIMHHNQSAQ